jgi:hypothetical protein
MREGRSRREEMRRGKDKAKDGCRNSGYWIDHDSATNKEENIDYSTAIPMHDETTKYSMIQSTARRYNMPCGKDQL